MRTVRLHRVGLFSTFRFGTILGGILLIVPVIFLTTLFFWSVSLLSGWMEGLRTALPLPGDFSLPVDVVSLLGLQQFFQVIKAVAGLSGWLAVFVSFFIWVFLSVLSGLLSLIAAAVFNVIASAAGGIEVDIDDLTVNPL